MENDIVSRPRLREHVERSVPVLMNIYSQRYGGVCTPKHTYNYFNLRIQLASDLRRVAEVQGQLLHVKTYTQIKPVVSNHLDSNKGLEDDDWKNSKITSVCLLYTSIEYLAAY